MTKPDDEIEDVEHFDNKLLVHFPDGKAAVLSGAEIHQFAVNLKVSGESDEDSLEEGVAGS